MAKAQLKGKESDFLKIVVAAAGRGDIDAVKQFLDDKPIWIRTVGSHGRTMLWEAAYRGKLDMVKFLVEQGANLDLPGCHLSQHDLEITPYCVAKHEGRNDVAEYLLEQGATIDIHTACYLRDYELAKTLLENDTEIVNSGYLQFVMLTSGNSHTFEHRETAWATPLCYAIVGGNIEIVQMLISYGAEIEKDCQILLDHAVSSDRVDITKLLFENGADPSKAPQVYDDNSAMSNLLKSYGVKPKDINALDKMGWPPLVYACRGDKGEHPEKIERFLELGAEIDVRSSKGKTALHCSAKAGFIKNIIVLIQKGATIDATDNNGETALYEAIRSTIKNRDKKLKTIETILKLGANPHVKNKKGLTPLSIAKQMRREDTADVVTLLEQYGAT